MWRSKIVTTDNSLFEESHIGAKSEGQFYAFATTRESARDVYSKEKFLLIQRWTEVGMAKLHAILTISVRIKEVHIVLERVNCVLRISGLYTSRLLDAACKKVLNLLKKGLLKVEATLKSAWTEKDQIDNLLKERRFNTTAGNPVKKILLKLNLSDHRLFKDGGGVIRANSQRAQGPWKHHTPMGRHQLKSGVSLLEVYIGWGKEKEIVYVKGIKQSPWEKDFQDNPDDEEDLRSSQEYMNDVKE
ncbi:hypothetical protein Tco_0247503 [Tanacetum coccineum]